MFSRLLLPACFPSLLLLAAPFSWAEPPVLSNYIDQDTLLVAQVRLAPLIEATQIDRWYATFEKTLNAHDKQAFAMLQRKLKGLEEAGVDQISLVVRVDDLRSLSGPLLLVTLQEGHDSGTAVTTIQNLLAEDKGILNVVVETDGQDLLLGTPKCLEQYQSLSAAPRADLLEPFEASEADSPLLTVVLSPGKDSRRVIRELWPRLSEPFTELTGPLLADRLQHAVLTLTKDPKLQARLTLSATDALSAARLTTLVENGIAYATDKVRSVRPDLASMAEEFVRQFSPTQEAARVAVIVELGGNQLEQFFSKAMIPALASAQEQRGHVKQMNSMKNIGLAFHHHHDREGHFPAPAAICDAQGEPLLSWRVALLPFLEHRELFSRFHLDEPWDSEHNLGLVREMPMVFADVMSPKLAPQGKTTFLRPLYSGGLADPSLPTENPKESFYQKQKYHRAPGLTFREYTDGTSHTLLVVQVAPEYAQPWTKPADWRVDLEHPAAKLQTTVRKKFCAGRVDGSVQVMDTQVSPARLRALITHAEGVPVPKE